MARLLGLEEVRRNTVLYIFDFFAALMALYIVLGYAGVVRLFPSQYLINASVILFIVVIKSLFKKGRLSYEAIVHTGILVALLNVSYILYLNVNNELRAVWFLPVIIFAYLYGSRGMGIFSTLFSLVTVWFFRNRLGYSAAGQLTFYISDLTISVVSLFFVEKFRQMSDLVHEAHEKLNRHAAYDYLTGIMNRRGFFETAAKVERGVVAILDVDRFKEINDRYGHTVGDEFLKFIVGRIRTTLRQKDLLARFGGDEFVVLFRDASLEDIEKWFERFYERLENSEFCYANVSVKPSVSAGLSLFSGDIDKSLEDADRNLYLAKRERGRWCSEQKCRD
jgi:diguanylate cyclase (GGDEF)-like protein